ncbi:MAG TPA: hypothetical protein VIM14_12065, partial [Polyangia bacterium]
MADESTLLPAVLDRIASLHCADIAIGIPTFNNADTVGPIVEAARAALRDLLADHPGVLIHADAGSTDDTAEKMASKDPADAPLVQLSYAVLPG